MSKARDAYGTALRELRDALRLGRYPAGAMLHLGDLAAELQISSTPIREALAHLAGEGLVDDGGGAGRRVPDFAPGEAAASYALMGLLLGEALTRMSTASPDVRERVIERWRSAGAARDEEEAAVDAASRLFRLLAQQAGDAVLQDAVRRADARLGLLRRAKARLLDQAGELDELAQSFVSAPLQMRQLCGLYHQRRILVADALSSAIDRIGK